MSHEVIIKFAPVFTLERFNDPTWRPDRRMYEPGALKFLPTRDTVPLIVDHDDDREIGTVQKLHRWDWIDGPWIFASATVTAPPPWLKRGTRVSFGSKIVSRRDVSIREYNADVVALAFVEEVSVLSPSVQPREPCAEVLSIRPIEKKPTSSPAAVTTTSNRAAAGEVLGGQRIFRRNIGQVLAVGGKPLQRTSSSGQAIPREHRDYIIDQPDGSQVIYSAEGYAEALRDGTLAPRPALSDRELEEELLMLTL